MGRFPFYGRGLAFPFRLDEATGGLKLVEGQDDGLSVALEYIAERWTIREATNEPLNLIADSIAHILLTHRTEHDTLPEFGSRLHWLLFEPNTEETYLEAEAYFWESTERWEKRAAIPLEGGAEWQVSGYTIDLHELGVILRPEFITRQAPRNLVAPFVTTREARLAEYPNPPDSFSPAGADYDSRYFAAPIIESGGVRALRLPITRPRYSARSDDIFRRWGLTDSWLLCAFWEYGETDGAIRFWDSIHECYVRDAAERGEGRAVLNPLNEPEIATALRMPSPTRLLMELAR